MNTISPLSAIPPAGSSTQQPGGKNQGGSPSQGQTFKAVVLESKGSNTFVLDINGSRVTAQAKIPLSVGQILQLQVAATTPQVQLKVVSDSANLFLGKSITLLGENINVRSLFQSLQNTPASLTQLTGFSRQTLESFFLFSQESIAGKESGVLLKQFIDRLGISFESLLARGDTAKAQVSLKSALLDLASTFRGAGELAESTNRLINTLELYQLAQLQLEKDDIFIFPLPVPFLQKGYLIIEHHRQNEQSDEQTSPMTKLSLHLTLEGLGNLRIEIMKSDEGIYLKFVSEDPQKLSFIESFKDDFLPQAIDSTLLGVTFAVDNVDPSAALLQKLFPEGESLVNTKI